MIDLTNGGGLSSRLYAMNISSSTGDSIVKDTSSAPLTHSYANFSCNTNFSPNIDPHSNSTHIQSESSPNPNLICPSDVHHLSATDSASKLGNHMQIKRKKSLSQPVPTKGCHITVPSMILSERLIDHEVTEILGTLAGLPQFGMHSAVDPSKCLDSVYSNSQNVFERDQRSKYDEKSTFISTVNNTPVEHFVHLGYDSSSSSMSNSPHRRHTPPDLDEIKKFCGKETSFSSLTRQPPSRPKAPPPFIVVPDQASKASTRILDPNSHHTSPSLESSEDELQALQLLTLNSAKNPAPIHDNDGNYSNHSHEPKIEFETAETKAINYKDKLLASTSLNNNNNSAGKFRTNTLQVVYQPLGPERPMSFFRLRDFSLVRPLGTGTFGRVYLACYTACSKYFALKQMRKIDVLRLQQVVHVRDERALLARLSHPFIVRLYAALQDERNLYMLMEYASGGELFHYLRRAHRFALGTTRFYAAELVLALEYLHSFGIAYRDLKPENLLLDAEGHLRLADFGFAKVVHGLTYTLCGTPEYLAPEIILGHGYDLSGDWWALGILIFEMLTGNPPFVGPTPTAVYEQTLSGGELRCDPAACGGRVLDLPTKQILQGLLTADPTRRLGCDIAGGGVSAIKNAPFFAGIDWDRLREKRYKSPIRPYCDLDPSKASNFPYDDSPSSMDVPIENELAIVREQGVSFRGFQVDHF